MLAKLDLLDKTVCFPFFALYSPIHVKYLFEIHSHIYLFME
jgi:hypothetical protein